MVPAFLKKDQQHERISLFMTFALKSSHLDRYIKEYSLKRNDTLDNLRASKYTGTALELATQKHVEIMKLVPEQG